MARRAVLIGFAVVLALIGLWRVVPWATQERTRIAGSPSLGGFFSANPVEVPGGEAACVAPVPLTADVARVQVIVSARSAQPLELSLTAPGYRAGARLPASYPEGGDTPVAFELDRSPPGDALGELCVRNAGRRTVQFAGTEEPRSVVVAQTKVDDELRPDMAVTFFSAERASTLGFAGTLVDHAAALTGGLLPEPLVWLLALAFVLGVPAGALVALIRSVDR